MKSENKDVQKTLATCVKLLSKEKNQVIYTKKAMLLVQAYTTKNDKK